MCSLFVLKNLLKNIIKKIIKKLFDIRRLKKFENEFEDTITIAISNAVTTEVKFRFYFELQNILGSETSSTKTIRTAYLFYLEKFIEDDIVKNEMLKTVNDEIMEETLLSWHMEFANSCVNELYDLFNSINP